MKNLFAITLYFLFTGVSVGQDVSHKELTHQSVDSFFIFQSLVSETQELITTEVLADNEATEDFLNVLTEGQNLCQQSVSEFHDLEKLTVASRKISFAAIKAKLRLTQVIRSQFTTIQQNPDLLQKIQDITSELEKVANPNGQEEL